MTARKEKFTPGPWHAHAGIMEPDYVFIADEENCDAENRVVCECFLRPGRYEESADVYLIAAAPEMYEMLAEIYKKRGQVFHFSATLKYTGKLAAILKKARGEE